MDALNAVVTVRPEVIGTLAMYCLATSATPGPNNLMLASSGLNYGFRRTLGLFVGIEVGFAALLMLAAAGLGTLVTSVPALQWALKLFGAGYLLWLATRLWSATRMADSAAAGPRGFWVGVALQAVNPKAWVMVIGAIGAFASTGAHFWSSVCLIAVTFVVVSTPCLLTWTLVGSRIRARLNDPFAFRLFNRALATLTVGTAALLFA